MFCSPEGVRVESGVGKVFFLMRRKEMASHAGFSVFLFYYFAFFCVCVLYKNIVEVAPDL